VTAVFTLVGVIMLGLVAALVLPSLNQLQATGRQPSHSARPTPTGSSPTGKPTKKPNGSPTPTPTSTMPSDAKSVLRKNPIYALKVPAHCEYQTSPLTAGIFRAQVKALVKCENTAWQKALASTPVEFGKPKIRFYGTRVSSPCGKLGSTFPAAYCSSNRTLYFSTASYTQGRYYRLAVAQFVMHEYAHHVQTLSSILPSSWALGESSSATSRRIELQAHCMAHYQLTHSSMGYNSSDRGDLEYQFGYTNDAKGHGSTTAERYWGRRGLSAGTIGACNTWSVKAGKVT
jgi:predicted metalloprotease